MMRLVLLRHAAAEAARPGLPDIDRALTPRGRDEALDAARCIAAARLRIDCLLVSPALRARETATLVAGELDISEPAHIESALYPGKPDELLQSLRLCAPGIGTVLMIGHNPGLSELAQRLHRGQPPIELRTAGLCCIEFDRQARGAQLRPELATRVTLMR
jgi:phosphohistidine phosphatase